VRDASGVLGDAVDGERVQRHGGPPPERREPPRLGGGDYRA
jgi:hypothetical protein